MKKKGRGGRKPSSSPFGKETNVKERKAREVLLKKEYDTEEQFLAMHYLRDKETGEVMYEAKYTGQDTPEEIFGVYCLKCGHLHEYSEPEYNKMSIAFREKGSNKTLKPCKCGRKAQWEDISITNGGAHEMKLHRSMWNAVPKSITLAKRDGQITISVTCRNWKFNAKASKPYCRDFQITAIVNTALGQTYIMPAQWNGKNVFMDGKDHIDHIRTASFNSNDVMHFINNNFFEKDDGTLVKVLREELAKDRPEIKGECRNLVDIIRANFLGELYQVFPKMGSKELKYDAAKRWRTLKRRYKKDPVTFPKYLTHGCTEVATKSVRKVLYKYPEQKWTLRFLYKNLGIKDPNILRAYLEDREGNAAKCANYFHRLREPVRKEVQIRRLADALSEAGLTDKQKAAFFLSGSIRFHNISDGAKMYGMYKKHVSTEDLLRYKSVEELHDSLAELGLKLRDRAMWDRYHEEIVYDEKILDIEGPIDNANFRIIKAPWDLRQLGKRFHNCVGSYMEDVKQGNSIIVEMLLNGKSAACIELDGEGKTCCQAFGSCNTRLDGDAAERFNEWIQRHGIKPGRMVPHMPIPPDDIVPF